ncbi:MAG: DUF4105 domain-containing protein [Kiritimatiellaeota bacterium]|nr:DUF4105 domain-containing protein [Kiritimatiellota bacterium]
MITNVAQIGASARRQRPPLAHEWSEGFGGANADRGLPTAAARLCMLLSGMLLWGLYALPTWADVPRAETTAFVRAAFESAAWQCNGRRGKVAALYGVTSKELPGRLASLSAPARAMVIQTGYAVLGLERASHPPGLPAALARLVTRLPGPLCFLPGVHAVEFIPAPETAPSPPPGTLPLAGDRVRVGIDATDPVERTFRALVFGLALALDRETGASRRRRFRAIHGWRRTWFGLGPVRPRDLALRRNWKETERPRLPAPGSLGPESVFAAAVAEFYAPDGRLTWSPLLGLYLRETLNKGRFADKTSPDELLFQDRFFALAWEDALGFRRRRAVRFRAAPNATTATDFDELTALYPPAGVALAGRGRAVESSCGHAMLLLRPQETPETNAALLLPGLAVTPAARVLGPRSMRRGFWGGYPSYYLVRESDAEIQTYQLEEREVRIYSFSAAVTPAERRRLVQAVLVYVPRYQGDYRFLTENCATLMADLFATALEPARAPPGALLERRTPRGLVKWLLSTGLLEQAPEAVFPPKSRLLAERLAALPVEDKQRRRFEAYLAHRRRTAITAALEQHDADRPLFDLTGKLRRLCEDAVRDRRRSESVDMYCLALQKDLDILIKRHVDAVFYQWLAGRVQQESDAERRKNAENLSEVERAVALQQRYDERAAEFMRFAARRTAAFGTRREATEKPTPVYADAVRRTLERNRAFRAARIPLAERFFGGEFGPRRSLHLKLVAATAELQAGY